MNKSSLAGVEEEMRKSGVIEQVIRKLIVMYGVLRLRVTQQLMDMARTASGNLTLPLVRFVDSSLRLMACLGNADSAGLMTNTPLKDDPKSVNVNTTFLLHLS